jgi:hypothetical protein
MFTSTRFLTDKLGVDPAIAVFFVDRPVPQNNRYWKDRLLYVAHGNGFLFIPLVYDILLNLGVSKEVLLEEGHVRRMEAILDGAGQVEYDGLPVAQHLDHCRTTMEGEIKNEWLWEALKDYFITRKGEPTGPLGLSIPALNRGDTFLFGICDLDMDEETTRRFLTYWYALIGSFLMMDDVVDWEWDIQRGEENSVQDLGEGEEALLKAGQMLKSFFATLDALNPLLGAHFDLLLQKHLRNRKAR